MHEGGINTANNKLITPFLSILSKSFLTNFIHNIHKNTPYLGVWFVAHNLPDTT
jgi:hypothetical protein